MKKLLLVVCLIAAFALTSCTEQARVKNFGGEMTINLPAGEKLMMATWKSEDLFYLTEPMEEDYQPKTKFFREASSFGIIEGTVKFVESR